MSKRSKALGTPTNSSVRQSGNVARSGAEAAARRASHSRAVRHHHRLVEMELDLPRELAERLAQRCAAEGITLSAGLSQALEQFFAVADRASSKEEN